MTIKRGRRAAYLAHENHIVGWSAFMLAEKTCIRVVRGRDDGSLGVRDFRRKKH